MGNLLCCPDPAGATNAPATDTKYGKLIDVCFEALAGEGQTHIKQDAGFGDRYTAMMEKVKGGAGLRDGKGATDEDWQKVPSSLRAGEDDAVGQHWENLVKGGVLPSPHDKEAREGGELAVDKERFAAWFLSNHGIKQQFEKKYAPAPARCPPARPRAETVDRADTPAPPCVQMVSRHRRQTRRQLFVM
eukprot:COSAG04_NODE_1387_length_6965_cov_11.221381_2_plen_189_part_00